MKKEDTEKLLERNRQIIDAVIQKGGEDIALIGITGSFQTGEYYEKSDLDLMIVSNSQRSANISSCFVMDDIGFDIYGTSWTRLEEMANYESTYVSKLMDADICYCPDPENRKRYMELRKKLEDTLKKPLSLKTYVRAGKALDEALSHYSRLMLNDEKGECRYYSASVLYGIKNVMCFLNNTYFKKGVKDHINEMIEMKEQPQGFIEQFNNAVKAKTVRQMKNTTTAVLKSVSDLYTHMGKQFEEKRDLTKEGLSGSYEEVWSNWKNKVYKAVTDNDAHAALMSGVMCQNFYINEMYAEYDMDKIQFMKSFDPDNLEGFAKAFDKAMEKYRKAYDKVDLKVRKYKDTEEFKKDYLG
jgi:predicted nucleotidyltransferase